MQKADVCFGDNQKFFKKVIAIEFNFDKVRVLRR